MNIAAVVVLYNPNLDVINNIKTYQKYVDCIILVDNSDSIIKGNKIFDELLKTSKYVYYIDLNGNHGIAKALNVGISKAKNKGMTHVLTMDQDSKFKNNIVECYNRYYNNPIYGDRVILCPKYCIDNKKITNNRLVYKKMKYVMQSANLIRVKDWEIIGPYKEDFFIDVVDYEYCIRAKKKGIVIVQCSDAILIHEPGIRTYKSFFGKRISYGTASPTRYYYQTRNLLWTYRNFKQVYFLNWLIIKIIKANLLFDNKKEYRVAIKQGILDAKNNKLGKSTRTY